MASKWLLAAYNVAAYLFLLAPIAIIVVLSFSDGSSLAFPPGGFSLRWFRYLAGRDEFIAATMVSLEVAAIASAGAVVLGTLAALALLHGRWRGKGAIEGALMSPLILPGIITGIALLQYFTAIGLVQSFTPGAGPLVICAMRSERGRVLARHRSVAGRGAAHARRQRLAHSACCCRS